MNKGTRLLKRVGLLGLALMLAGGVFSIGPARAENPIYNVVCGPEGNTGMVVGAGVFPLINKWTGKVTLLPVAGGSLAGIRNYARGADIQGVFTNHATLEDMWTNAGPFAAKPMKKKLYQSVYFSPTAFFMLAKADSGIKSYGDLAGKTISVGSAKWSFVPNMVAGLKAMGVWDNVKNKYMGAGELPDALRSGIVDAVIGAIAGNLTVPPWTQKIALYNDVVALDMTKEQIAAFKKAPGVAFDYQPNRFDQDVGVDQIPSLIQYYGYHFGEDTDPEIVYAIVKAWFEHPENLPKIHKSLKYFVDSGKKLAMQGISAAPHAPVHPGAARYYKEIGVWNEGWNVGK